MKLASANTILRLGNDAVSKAYLGTSQVYAIGGGIDEDAQAYFTAVESDGSVLTPTQKTNRNNLIVELKQALIWNKIKDLCLFTGGTSSINKWNVKNPLNTDAAFRSIFVGSPIPGPFGISFNGTTQYIRTNLIPANALTLNKTHLSYFSFNSDGNGTNEMVIYQAESQSMELIVRRSNNLSYSVAYDEAATLITGSTTDGKGLFMSNRTSQTYHELRRNKTVLASTALSSAGTLPTIEMLINAANTDAYGVVGFSPRTVSLASIGDDFTPTQADNFSDIVTQFLTAEGLTI